MFSLFTSSFVEVKNPLTKYIHTSTLADFLKSFALCVTYHLDFEYLAEYEIGKNLWHWQGYWFVWYHAEINIVMIH